MRALQSGSGLPAVLRLATVSLNTHFLFSPQFLPGTPSKILSSLIFRHYNFGNSFRLSFSLLSVSSTLMFTSSQEF